MYNNLLGNLVVRLTGESTQFERMLAGAGAAIDRTAKQLVSAGQLMTKAVTLPLTAIGVLSVKVAGDFETAMTKSLSHFRNISGGLRTQMEDTARTMARNGKFSAVELADAYGMLAYRGLSGQRAMAQLAVAEKFATANSVSLEKAISILTDAQDELGMTSRDAKKDLENLTKIADGLTEAALLGDASIEELGKSLEKHGASSMRRFNIPLKEGLALLVGLSLQGAKAGQAGQYMADLFGGRNLGTRKGPAKDAIAALQMNIGDVRNFEQAIDKSKGVTDKMANETLKGFNVEMSKMLHNIEDVGIDIGNILLPAIRQIAIWVEKATTYWKGLSTTTKSWIVGLGIALATLGPLLLFVVTAAGAMAVIWPLIIAGVGTLTVMFATMASVAIGALSSIGVTGLVAFGAVALALYLVIDLISQMTGHGSIGVKQMEEKFRVGGHNIATWMDVTALHMVYAFDYAFNQIEIGWSAVKGFFKEAGFAIWREMLKASEAGIEALLGLFLKIPIIGDETRKALQLAMGGVKIFIDNALEESLKSSKDNAKDTFKDIAQLNKEYTTKQKEFQEQVDNLFKNDTIKNAQEIADKKAEIETNALKKKSAGDKRVEAALMLAKQPIGMLSGFTQTMSMGMLTKKDETSFSRTLSKEPIGILSGFAKEMVGGILSGKASGGGEGKIDLTGGGSDTKALLKSLEGHEATKENLLKSIAEHSADVKDTVADAERKTSGAGESDKMPGDSTPNFDDPKIDPHKGTQAFEQISLRRFGLAGPGGLAQAPTQVQEVKAKGVEARLDAVINVLKEKQTISVLQ